jgi:Holin of 3TMs, for gene-transfer release
MAIELPWTSLINKVGDLIGKVLPDKAAADAAKAQLQLLAAQGALQEELASLMAVTTAQTDINKVEAASLNWWVAGWRPYIGWICGTGLAMSAIVGPLFTWITMLAGHPTPFPIPNNPLLQGTLAGLLGLGHVSRTIEKIQGVVGDH